MSIAFTADRYSKAQRALHWLSVLAITIAYVAIEIRGDMPKTNEWRPFVTQLHFWAGLSVLAMVVARIYLRWRRPTPAVTPAPSTLVARLATITHGLIYAVLLVQPVLGMLAAAAGGKAIIVPLLGIALPALIAPSHALEEQYEEWHETLGELFYWVIGLHVAAALWHHFMRRDNTLQRML
ncbi:MAG: cytochrome b [Xanthomonadaceae bacterium]|nr:cytochrome b [Xanthomonadaceae bacterium]MDP2186846.1 cytochrome b [Xanthomonadales bacterium]MDZ4114949.1 cytochrome b [Xanthomonadaceae bacterium]MDZ4376894.1 cytochrome b [Xanthomonadaceae bacterium]